MPTPTNTPGVYVQEIGAPPPPVDIPTSITAFVGRTVRGPVNEPVAVNSWAEYDAAFGELDEASGVSWQVRAYFDNGGAQALVVRLAASAGEAEPLTAGDWLGDRQAKTGLYALEAAAGFNILCVPPDTLDGETPPVVLQAAAELCVERDAMLIIDPPGRWQALYEAGQTAQILLDDLGAFSVEGARSSAVYFPRVRATNPRDGTTARTLPNCGWVAGIWARTDIETGVWKAPAGVNATLNGIRGLAVKLTDADSGILNPLGINSLRDFPMYGPVVWGTRTLRGAEQWADSYKYVPTRRLALYIQSWLRTSTAWATFEPNAPVLWARLTAQVSTFLNGLWKQGALFGSKPDDSYFVHCDASTTPPDDLAAGVTHVQIGFAPVRPAEFILLTVAVKTAQP